MKARQQGGFTLVELLIVIVVIAILATISIIAYNGIQQRAYLTRAMTELSLLAKATKLYYVDNEGTYPEDADRDVPVGIIKYTGRNDVSWPIAPWPNSIYDYDYYLGSDGGEAVQISVRFCPIHGSLSDCSFPKDSWAADFGIDSSAYWCIAGKCRSHPEQADSYPGYCLNCKE